MKTKEKDKLEKDEFTHLREEELISYYENPADPSIPARIKGHIGMCLICKMRLERIVDTLSNFDKVPVTAHHAELAMKALEEPDFSAELEDLIEEIQDDINDDISVGILVGEPEREVARFSAGRKNSVTHQYEYNGGKLFLHLEKEEDTGNWVARITSTKSELKNTKLLLRVDNLESKEATLCASGKGKLKAEVFFTKEESNKISCDSQITIDLKK